jgi:hypothetical protein
VGSYEYSNVVFGSIKCWEVLERLHKWHLLKKGSAPWSYLGGSSESLSKESVEVYGIYVNDSNKSKFDSGGK